jgi:hypothetical protein
MQIASVAVSLILLALAMANGANTQSINGIYKTVFEDYVAEQVNNKFPMKDAFKPTTAEYAGQDVVYNAHTGRNVSPMWVGEDSAFAAATPQASAKVHVGQRKLMARVRLTSEVLFDTAKSEGAWKQARKDEMTRLVDDIARMDEYSLTSDGRGVLSLINDASTTGSVVLGVDSPGGLTGADFGNRFFLPGMFIIAVNPATGEARTQARKVVACSSDGTTITLDAICDATWADNDYLVQAANLSITDVLDTSYEHAAWGIMALIDDGTYRNNYFNVPRDRYPQYKSYVKASTGTLSEDLLQTVADVQDQLLGGTTSEMSAHHSVRRLVIKLTQPDRRYSGNNLDKPDAGTTAFTQGDIPFGGIPIKAMRTHPLATLIGYDKKGMEAKRYQSDPGGWVDEDGRILVRVGSGDSARDAFEAWYRKRYQNHLVYPGKCWRLDGITGQSLIVVREAGS